jgi:hypothetical protein
MSIDRQVGTEILRAVIHLASIERSRPDDLACSQDLVTSFYSHLADCRYL